MQSSSFLSLDVVLLAGVTAIATGSSLFLIDWRCRACHGCRSALVILFGLIATASRNEGEDTLLNEHTELQALLGKSRGIRAPIYALTDRGRPIPLTEGAFDRDMPLVARDEDRRFMHSDIEPIRTALPNPVSNCHGWTFAGGRYWVDGDDVMQILEDNSYSEVSVPEAGDVVVYYNSDEVLHSGVVRSRSDRGPVLVESKMAKGSRWIHALAEPPSYFRPWWSHWRFFRSTREGGHVLRKLGESYPPATPCSLRLDAIGHPALKG